MPTAEDTTPEEWRDLTPAIVGFPIGVGYQASSLGRIRSRRRSGPHQHCGLRKTWRVLKSVVNRDGYARCTLVNGDGSSRIWQGHRLIALAFLGPAPVGKEMVCHDDGNPANNAASNLKWGSGGDNAADAVRHGTHPAGESHGMTDMTAEQVREAVHLYDAGWTLKALAARYGVTRVTISNIVRGKTWATVTGRVFTGERIKRRDG